MKPTRSDMSCLDLFCNLIGSLACDARVEPSPISLNTKLKMATTSFDNFRPYSLTHWDSIVLVVNQNVVLRLGKFMFIKVYSRIALKVKQCETKLDDSPMHAKNKTLHRNALIRTKCPDACSSLYILKTQKTWCKPISVWRLFDHCTSKFSSVPGKIF